METANSWDEAIQYALDSLDAGETQWVATISANEYRRKMWFAMTDRDFRMAVAADIIPMMYPASSFRIYTKDLVLQGKPTRELVIVYLQEGETI